MEKITTELTHAGQKISTSEMKLMLDSGIPLVDFEITQKHPLEIQDIITAENCYKVINEISIPTLLSSLKTKINLLNDLNKLVKQSMHNLDFFNSSWTWKVAKTEDGYAAYIHLELDPKIKKAYDYFLKSNNKSNHKENLSNELLDTCARLFAEILSDIKFIYQT